MRTTITTLILCLASASVLAQGRVTFGNDSDHLFVLGAVEVLHPADAAQAGQPIPVSPLPSGITLVAGLFAGPGTSNPVLMLATKVVLDSSGWLAPGRMVNTPIALPGLNGGARSSFQVCVWDNAFATPAEVLVGGGYLGSSPVFTALAGPLPGYPYPGILPRDPSQSTWAPGSLVIGWVPEPASGALLGFGLASLLLCRCRHR